MKNLFKIFINESPNYKFKNKNHKKKEENLISSRL